MTRPDWDSWFDMERCHDATDRGGSCDTCAPWLDVTSMQWTIAILEWETEIGRNDPTVIHNVPRAVHGPNWNPAVCPTCHISAAENYGCHQHGCVSCVARKGRA